MGLHGCLGGCFCFEIQFFSSIKASNHNLKTSFHDWGWEVYRGLGLKINNKICNVWHNVGFVLIFNK
jgi:hypothetical protein